MPSAAASLVHRVSPKDRLEMLFDELAELTGQRNAIDGRIVDIVAELERDGLWGMTGARSMTALVAWKTGATPHNAETLLTVARRIEDFPRCADALREGRLSLDRLGVLAEHAADGSDDHYIELAEAATVNQLRTAVKQEPRPEPEPKPEPDKQRSITKTVHDGHTTWQIRLPKLEAAKFEAAMQSHRDAQISQWKRDHDTDDTDDTGEESPEQAPEQAPPFPDAVDAFMALVEAGWDADVARRPHGQHTTAAVHVDLDKPTAALHLGQVLNDEERRYLLCDATCEVWLKRHGQLIGAARSTRTINRRLRRALEYRDQCCVVPGCGATRGLHAHHLVHWEDGGPTELWNLALVCPFHHRAHHRGEITITGPADRLVVTNATGQRMTNRSLARPPTTPPPDVKPCPGPTGERADWWWYTPFEPKPPPAAA
ncbi:HNH endonuclease signature motif containing protein [Mycobacterium sp. 852013-51886_SCH5428379]|uniref:HNH endonuclease signature motif containing protein n=1 Tax=Mycobacterium sp. 852013-51886_SCH5428379 TaxID=1834111 RepID=UPI0009EF346C|nr:HNH endonuclease signature motif containing protein [Mycobacterium sp. 852013-51886_SCH5428379]